MTADKQSTRRSGRRRGQTDRRSRVPVGSRLLDAPRRALLLASLLSGVAALAYELLWVRKLTLLAGSTQAAISAVLAAYFLGLALGNYFAGRFAHRIRRPMLIYVGIELLIGLWALLFHPLMDGLEPLYTSLYAGLPAGSPLIHLLRITTAAGLLLVPATCMGATIPLLAQFGAPDLKGAPRWSALLYGVNTLGAMIGTFVTGFYLIEHFGVSGPLRLFGLVNLACAALVWPWVKQRTLASKSPQVEKTSLEERPGKLSRFSLLILLFFGVLGFCNIAMEVLWTSFFSLIYPNDTYVYTTLLLMFLFGVGAGSLVGQFVVTKIRRAVYLLGILQLVSAVASILMTHFVPTLVGSMMESGEGFGAWLRAYFTGIGAGTLVPTLCMGASFPLLVKIVLSHREQTGGIVGRALAWNTLGGVVGSLVGGFVGLNLLGLQPSLFIAAGLTAAVGVALCAMERDLPHLFWAPVAALGVPLLLGTAVQSPRLPDALFEMHFPVMPKYHIMETRSSVHGTVAVTLEPRRVRRVWINSNWVASSRAHLAFGYAPWLLHGKPVETALGICCGTGRTFGALYNAGIPDLDLVDINPAVIDLSSRLLADVNHGVLSNPDVRVILDDGRNFVRYGTKQYDLITLEPLQMYQKGVAYFYTQDFYREARARMTPGGVICQWAPLYLMDPHEFASIIKTFIDVFPNSLMWGRRGHSMVLLGYNDDLAFPDFDESRTFERVMMDVVRADLAVEEIEGKYDPLVYSMVAGDGLRRLGEPGQIYTDDRPTLEFTAPRTLATPEANLARIAQNLTPLADLFDLRDPDLLADLEQLRRLTLQVSAKGADVRGLTERIKAVRNHIYAEADTTRIDPEADS